MVEVPIKEALEQATKALQAVGWDKANAALQVFFDLFTRARRARRARGGGWNCYSFLVVGAVVVAGRTTTTSVYLFHASAHARASLERAIVSPLWTSGAVARLGADDVPKEELSMCPNMRRPPRTHRTSRRPPFPRPPPPQTARCCCGRSAGAAPPRPPRSLCSAPRRRDPPRDGALAARSRAFAARRPTPPSSVFPCPAASVERMAARLSMEAEIQPAEDRAAPGRRVAPCRRAAPSRRVAPGRRAAPGQRGPLDGRWCGFSRRRARCLMPPCRSPRGKKTRRARFTGLVRRAPRARALRRAANEDEPAAQKRAARCRRIGPFGRCWSRRCSRRPHAVTIMVVGHASTNRNERN